MLKKLFNSKKFWYFMMGVVAEVVVAFNAFGLGDLSPELRMKLMEMIGIVAGGGLLGQGLADHGKEKAKVEASKE